MPAPPSASWLWDRFTRSSCARGCCAAGASDDELTSSFPGADLVPGGVRTATMAVTIDAPPSRVWPWLVQMGTDRGGWYSWDLLDNFGRRSADRIHPEWQKIDLGDRFTGKPRSGGSVRSQTPDHANRR